MRFDRTLCGLFATSLAAALQGQCATSWLQGDIPGVGRGVQAVAMWDPDGPGPLGERLVLGGNFLAAGSQSVNHVAMWDPATGQFAPLGVGLGTAVISLATHANGDLIANGAWRWNGASWVPLGTPPQFPGPAVILPGGDVVAAHRIWHQACGFCGGAYYAEVRRWNGTAWAPLGASPGFDANSAIYDFALLPNGDLVAGGAFATAGGAAAPNVARWDGTAWSSLGGGTNGYVSALAVLPNGDLVAGGRFTMAGGAPAANIARWDGAAWSPLGAGLDNYVHDVAVLPNGELIASGIFAVAGGIPVQGLARWNGAAWAPFDASGAGHYHVHALASTATGEVYAGGSFTSLGGIGAVDVARFDGAAWSALWHGWNGPIEAALPLRGGDLVVGGDFTQAGSVAAARIARWNGAVWSPLGAGLGGDPPGDRGFALLELANGDLVAGGSFTIAGNVAVNHIARWDGAGWSPLGAGLPYPVQALRLLPNGDLAAGVGNFPGPGEVWRWNGVAWARLGPTMDGVVSALGVSSSGELLAGGRFQTIGAVAVPHLARWSGAGWSAFAGGRPAAVDAILELRNGDLAVGGQFPSLGFVTRWNGTSWSGFGTGLGATFVASAVESLVELPDGDLVAAGAFAQSLGGLPALRNIARWDGAAWLPLGGGLDGRAHTLAMTSTGELFVGGAFATADARPSAFAARLATSCPAAALVLPTACVGSVGPVVASVDGLPWTGATVRALAHGFAPNALAVSLLGLSSPNVSLAWLGPTALPGCNQLASHEAIVLHVPQAGAAASAFAIPNDAVFAGVVLWSQFLQFEVGAQGQLGPISGSNGLRLTVGSF